MRSHYLGQLQIEANVPDKPDVNEFINVTVDFHIYCPECGPENAKFKKDGHDTKVKGCPQKFKCNICGNYFYPHTSWLFKQFTNIIISDIVDFLFVENLQPKAIAKMLDVSDSLISKIKYQCFDVLYNKVKSFRSKFEELKKIENLPLEKQSAIYWDETYFRIGKKIFCLILIINANGKVLGYRFGKTRTKEDYLSILLPIIDTLPEIPIFICDGCPTYEGVCKQLKMECFLFQHIHSRPWKDAKLHHFKPIENTDELEIISIQVPYDCFTEEKSVKAFAITKKVTVHDRNKVKTKRGRPKGTKDKIKRARKGTLSKKKANKKSLKRGKKSIVKNGAEFTFEPFPYPNGWEINLLSKVKNSSNLYNPTPTDISVILSVAYKVMDGSFIQSNLIESKNHVIKQAIPTTGLKDVYQGDYLLGVHLLAKNDIDQCYWDCPETSANFHNSLGFRQMFRFIQPDSAKIEIFKEVVKL